METKGNFAMPDEKTTPEEEWRPIPGHPDHEASSLGRIRSKPRTITYTVTREVPGRVLRGHVSGHNGYHYVNIAPANQQVTSHTLVLAAFSEPCPPGMECRHLDGSRTNNLPTNLRWGTPKENCADKKVHGTENVGARNGMAKLTEQQVREIRAASGAQREIAARYDIHQVAVSQIKTGKRWSHLK
jgi:hypothetical protein